MKLLGTGSFLPATTFTNSDLEEMVDTNAKWIEETLGIKERRITWQPTSSLAMIAAERAIFNSGLNRDEIDLLIVATATPDRQAPSTACIIQTGIGVYNAVAFDVSAVCSGFLYAMSIADSFLSMGTYKNALVIGADTFSKVTDWTRRDAVFFGDGAGAAVFTYGKQSFFRLYSDGRGKEGFTVKHGQKFDMIGKAVYNAAVNFLPEAIADVLDDAGLSIEDIDIMIPHQPSIGILKETAKRIGLPFEKVATNMDKYANTAGATIPILLDENSAWLRKSNVLFAAMGSGWTWGAGIMEI